jgi:polysaccharide pyruvyl transferase WcaK-like protein
MNATPDVLLPRAITANRGDLASRLAIAEALFRRGMRPLVSAHRPEHLGSLPLPRGGLGRCFNLLPDAATARALRTARTVLWTAGLDLQDDSSLLKLLHLLLLFRGYRRRGKRIVALMQGAGPLETRAGRGLTRRILDLVDVFVARDRGTLSLLEGLGGGASLRRGHDGIFLDGWERMLTQTTSDARVAALAGRSGDRPVVGVNLRLWFHFASSMVPYMFLRNTYLRRARPRMDELVAAVRALVRHLREEHDARVLLLSMYEPGVEPWEDDLPFLREVKEAFAGEEHVVLVEADLPILSFCRLLGELDLMIGMRLHSTLIALRMGTPAINLNYTLKGRAIYTDLGLADWIVDLETFMLEPGRVGALADAALADTDLPARVRACVRAACGQNERILDDLFGPRKDPS